MRKPFVTGRIQRLVKRINARIVIEPEYEHVAHITFANGKTTLFRDTSFNITHYGSVRIAERINHIVVFLRLFGFSVPKTRPFLIFRAYFRSQTPCGLIFFTQ